MSLRKFVSNHNLGELSSPHRIFMRILEFFYLWYREVKKDHSIQRAASLTYTTILAIFPMVAVMALFIPAFFGGPEQMESDVIEYVQSILLPDAGDEIEKSISQYFSTFRENSKAVGVFGVLGLMLSAMLLFSNMEKSFNEIWRARRHRSLVAVLSRFTTVLIFVPILIGFSIVLTPQLTKRVEMLGRLYSLALPYLMTCLALTLAFFILPNTRVRFFYAFIGGFVAGLVWEVAKVAFGYYMASPKIELIYKSLGAIPIFLIWIFFTWLIVLLGCELSYLIQNYNHLRFEAFRKIPHTILDAKLIFLVFLVIADDFRKGKGGVDFSQLLGRIPIKTEEMEVLMKRLQKAGLITETADGLFIPTKPLDNLKPSDILKLGCRADRLLFREERTNLPLVKTIQHLQESVLEWEQNKTIRDILTPPEKISL